jgi:DNA polymerase delta subunit OB-fold domain
MVPRVLDVVKGGLCWIVGTVYMDMVLKPKILEGIGREVRATPLLNPPSLTACFDMPFSFQSRHPHRRRNISPLSTQWYLRMNLAGSASSANDSSESSTLQVSS